jgi:hypothetical protein
MWQLFRPFPVIGEVSLSVRDIVAAGALVQRELVSAHKFGAMAQERGLGSVDRKTLEAWDRRGFIAPLAFVRSGWTSWHWTEPYPVEGIEFRDENGFRPWADYEFERHGFADVTALYSEWQLLYLPIAQEAHITRVPSEVLLDGGERLVEWAQKTRWFIEANFNAGSAMHDRWLPTIKVLLRLQARYWPYVRGRSILLRNSDGEQVDALEMELQAATAEQVLEGLGFGDAEVRAQYQWFAHRALSFDPAERLYELLRLEPPPGGARARPSPSGARPL